MNLGARFVEPRKESYMSSMKFLPINLSDDFPTCVEFLLDAFVCSYGNTDELERMGRVEVY